MALHLTDPTQLNGMQVLGRDGEKLGKVENVFFDNETDRPEWAAVKTGLFGSHVSLVPLATAELEGDTLRVPYGKDQFKSAPHSDPDRELSVEDEQELFEHYGVPYAGETATAQPGRGRTAETGRRHERRDRDDVEHARGRDTSGPTTDDAMTRSEERLRVGTEQREAGRARLRKHVVTEHVQQTVPVSHEEVRVEREPITEENRGRATDGPAISEEEHEVVLHEERPVVAKEAVPVERVRLGAETVTDQEQIDEQVRKEEIEVDDTETGRRGR